MRDENYATYHHDVGKQVPERNTEAPRRQAGSTTHINSDHRETLKRIFGHPSSGNIEWRQVRSLLEAVGTVTEEHNGKLVVVLGGETEVLQPPHGKDIDLPMIVDLRRMLKRAEIAPSDV